MFEHVYAYVRISYDPHSLRAGVTRQIKDCETTARARGWLPNGSTMRVFEDNDRSAWKGRRPMFEALIDELPSATALVAYDVDRLVRQPRDLERLLDRCVEVKLHNVATAQGDIDLTTHDGQLHARILAAVARKESDDKSRRVARAARDKAEKGEFGGSQAPYGYRLVSGSLVVCEEEAEQVRDSVQAILSGGALAVEAEKIGMTPAGLRRLLRSPTITGHTVMWQRGWEPIVDDATAGDLRAMLDDRRRVTPRRSDHWLTGILACVNCKWTTMVFGGGASPGYRCPECGNFIIKEPTEVIVRDALFDAVEKFVTPAPPAPTVQTVTEQQREWRLADLAKDYAAGVITRGEWLAAREAVAPSAPPRIVRQLEPPPRDLAVIWPELDGPGRRRQALRLLDRVEVARARGRRGVFDPGRLTPRWRQ